MKFGKVLYRCRDLSHPEWSEKWINYKQLKKILKVIQKDSTPSETAAASNGSLAEELASSPLEVEFFTHLQEQLQKISEFYDSIEYGMCTQYHHLIESFSQQYGGLDASNILRKLSETDALQLLDNIAKFYTDLLLLENFAVMNYCGFGKILKKHDKVTGFETKSSFMQRVVNQQEFARHERLLKMLQRTEHAYKRLLYVIPHEMRHSLMGSDSALSTSVCNVTACTEQHRYSLGEATCNCAMHCHSTTPTTGASTQHHFSVAGYPSLSAFSPAQQLQQAVYAQNNDQNAYGKYPYVSYASQQGGGVWLDEFDRQAAAAIASVRRNR
eukprot:gb/GECG01000787.1/.p1 GENE.gb/GECG01000787.1/~~gb/GECG01000787.1/.p1  ORF type:complete len:327 (+),score=46.88 gb/GECG01000787.1/:1-981(+)